MNIYQSSSPRSSYDFFFSITLIEPLVIATQELRSEEEYDQDQAASNTALKLTMRFLNEFSSNRYSIIASPRIAPHNKLRTKKGILPYNSGLRKLPHRELESFRENQHSRLGVIVDLENIAPGVEDTFLLNWIDGAFALTSMTIDQLQFYVERWLSIDPKSVLGFNYDAIAKDILSIEQIAVARYFPADNRKFEAISVLCTKGFFDSHIAHCFNSFQPSGVG